MIKAKLVFQLTGELPEGVKDSGEFCNPEKFWCQNHIYLIPEKINMDMQYFEIIKDEKENKKVK